MMMIGMGTKLVEDELGAVISSHTKRQPTSDMGKAVRRGGPQLDVADSKVLLVPSHGPAK